MRITGLRVTYCEQLIVLIAAPLNLIELVSSADRKCYLFPYPVTNGQEIHSHRGRNRWMICSLCWTGYCFYQVMLEICKLLQNSHSLHHGQFRHPAWFPTLFCHHACVILVWLLFDIFTNTKLVIMALMPTLHSHMSHFAYACKMEFPA